MYHKTPPHSPPLVLGTVRKSPAAGVPAPRPGPGAAAVSWCRLSHETQTLFSRAEWFLCRHKSYILLLLLLFMWCLGSVAYDNVQTTCCKSKTPTTSAVLQHCPRRGRDLRAGGRPRPHPEVRQSGGPGEYSPPIGHLTSVLTSDWSPDLNTDLVT